MGNILEKAGSSEDIEDCISDVYIKLLENQKIYDHKKGSLKSFLVRIGKNLAIDKYRKLTRGKVTAIHEHTVAHIAAWAAAIKIDQSPFFKLWNTFQA